MNRNIVILRARKGVPGVGRRLARHFNCDEVTSKSYPKLKIQPMTLIFNYGRSVDPVWLNDALLEGCIILNDPNSVSKCVNKLETLKTLTKFEIPTLEFFDNFQDVKQYMEDNPDYKVIVRHLLNSKKGKGIELITDVNDLPEAPLYTAFYDKTHEYRVHVFGGKVIDFVQKKKMGKKKLNALGLEEPNMLIRNNKRGWAFCRQAINYDTAIEQLAIAACDVVGVYFAGVDILAKWKDGKLVDAVVCEINSAPGMSDKNTFNAYTKAIEQTLLTLHGEEI